MLASISAIAAVGFTIWGWNIAQEGGTPSNVAMIFSFAVGAAFLAGWTSAKSQNKE